MPFSHLRMQMLRSSEVANRHRRQQADQAQTKEWVPLGHHFLACLIDCWLPNNRWLNHLDTEDILKQMICCPWAGCTHTLMKQALRPTNCKVILSTYVLNDYICESVKIFVTWEILRNTSQQTTAVFTGNLPQIELIYYSLGCSKLDGWHSRGVQNIRWFSIYSIKDF